MQSPREILRRYPGVTALNLTKVEPEGFSGALVFKVDSTAGPFALRRWPAGALPKRRLLGLHRLLRFTFDQGCAFVAVPLQADDGSTLVIDDGFQWQLEPWMPGRADFHENPSDARLAAAMRTLAEWHRAAARFRARDDEAEWFSCRSAAISPAVSERLARLLHWQNGQLDELEYRLREALHDEMRELAYAVARLFRICAPAIANELEGMRNVPVPLQPCLRDVWHDHILYIGDELTGLIDASACRMETPATDLARLLGSFLGDNPERWEFALHRYSAMRPLAPDEYRLVRVLDRSAVLLTGLTWLERRYFGPFTYVDPRILKRLQANLVRLERLSRDG